MAAPGEQSGGIGSFRMLITAARNQLTNGCGAPAAIAFKFPFFALLFLFLLFEKIPLVSL